MKVTYNWLKDFVDIKVAPGALADKLTMAGLEVTSVEERGGDFVFEIEITSNRPDWLSVAGVAREVAAITGKKLIEKSHKVTKSQNHKAEVKIEIENKKDCPLYTAKIIKNVKVGVSPEWLKKRLELVGCRSVNNVVDITNYILFETGEPLHAFDLDKLQGNAVIVRRAKHGEKITTIDAQERPLNTGILIIADERKPIAIAGVMGGRETEVTETTRNILLEAAVFNPAVVRRGRRSAGIQSESSYRFERGVDLEKVTCASSEAAGLILGLAGGDLTGARTAGLAKSKKRTVKLDLFSVNKILGANINAARMKSILKSLGFKTSGARNVFTVKVPHFRFDVNSPVDLVEEIARVHGYENIAMTLPRVKPKPRLGEQPDKVALIKDILTGLGLNEVITYSLMDKSLLREFGMYAGAEALEVLNPLSAEQEILRPALIPGVSACVARNLNQKQDYVNIFEVAKAFGLSGGVPSEELRLCIALCGTKSMLLDRGVVKDTAGFLQLKGIIETVFERLGLKAHDFRPSERPSVIDILLAQEKIGMMQKLDQPALARMDIKNKDLFVAELSLERLLFYYKPEKKFSRLPAYPGISRDISLVIKEEITAGQILETVKEEGSVLLRQARISDCYQGKQIPAGFKGLTISCLYRSDERTLTEEEIEPLHSAVFKRLYEKFGAQIR